jgi:hypothetical protein
VQFGCVGKSMSGKKGITTWMNPIYLRKHQDAVSE